MHGTILVIAGSVRGRRRSPVVAQWVAELGRAAAALAFEAVDLRELGLTLDDEPGMPALGAYASPATRAWSARVSGCAGVVFVTPQYNWGYPAALKNAIDHLHDEWRGKPAAIVTYGGHGGGKCAAQLREVLTGLHMALVDPMPALRLGRDRIVADDGAIDPQAEFGRQQAEVEAALAALADAVSASREA